jgi:hypothetical protein
LRPFAGVGYDPRIVNGTSNRYGCSIASVNVGGYACQLNIHQSEDYPLTHGLVVSGGLDLGIHHIRFAPELRYVHWNAPYFEQFPDDGFPGFSSRQNELFVLVGLGWR